MLRSARNSDMEYNETSLTLLQKMVKVFILNTTHTLDRERKAKKKIKNIVICLTVKYINVKFRVK